MSPQQVAAALGHGAVPLDMRPPRPFATGHLPGAVNLQFNRADLADRAEMVLPTDVPYIVHAEPDPVAKAAEQILREAGFTVLGHLAGGLRAWRDAGQSLEELPAIDVDHLHSDLSAYEVVDAREGYEYRHGHIAGAVLLPSSEAWQRASATRGEKPLAVVCGDQVRSSLVASILLRHGRQAVLVFGGMVDWLERGFEVEKPETVTKPS
jgi:hydroxyacylglutathione hydrolase